MNLNTRQKAYLRGLGQALRAQLHIGHDGLNEGTRGALEDLFKRRELVKVRILRSSDDDPKKVAEALAERASAAVAGIVGQTFLLYRPNPELKERIELPQATAARARGGPRKLNVGAEPGPEQTEPAGESNG